MLLVAFSVCLTAEASAEAVVLGATPAIGTPTAIEAGGQATPPTGDPGAVINNVWRLMLRGSYDAALDQLSRARILLTSVGTYTTKRIGMRVETLTLGLLQVKALVEMDDCAEARPLFDAVEAEVAGTRGNEFGEQGLRDLRQRCDFVSRSS